MTTICCISDLHGNLPPIPDCDILCIAGDIVPIWCQNNIDVSRCWYETNFKNWLLDLCNRGIEVFGIAGNHDFIMEHSNNFAYKLPWRYLQDEYALYKKEDLQLKIYGTPWQPWFGGWAFNLSEERLSEKWEFIPMNTDILIVHGPPYMYGDKIVNYGGRVGEVYIEHPGSTSLLMAIEHIQPKLVVVGHIHTGYGQYHINNSLVVNASLVNHKYQPVNEPILVEV